MNQGILPGFDFESFGAENEDDLGVFDRSELEKSYLWATDWTVGTIISQIERGNIILDPEFQRRDAWQVPRKSRFIESIILNLPIPQIVLAERDKKLVVVDGKQRLLSIMQFVGTNGWKSFELKDLQILNINGYGYADIENSDYASAFENNTIRTVILKNKPSKQLINIVFSRLNTNSVALSPQELRQSLQSGDFTTFVNRYTQDNTFLAELFGREEPDFRMRDVELLIRHLAFKLNVQSYNGNLKTFLDSTCEELNKSWASESKNIEQMCENLKTANSVYLSIFKKHAYRKYIPSEQEFEYRFNRAIFDVVTHYLSDSKILQNVQKNTQNFIDSYIKLFDIPEFISSIESTTKSNNAVETRFGLFGDMISKI